MLWAQSTTEGYIRAAAMKVLRHKSEYEEESLPVQMTNSRSLSCRFCSLLSTVYTGIRAFCTAFWAQTVYCYCAIQLLLIINQAVLWVSAHFPRSSGTHQQRNTFTCLRHSRPRRHDVWAWIKRSAYFCYVKNILAVSHIGCAGLEALAGSPSRGGEVTVYVLT